MPTRQVNRTKSAKTVKFDDSLSLIEEKQETTDNSSNSCSSPYYPDSNTIDAKSDTKKLKLTTIEYDFGSHQTAKQSETTFDLDGYEQTTLKKKNKTSIKKYRAPEAETRGSIWC